MKNTLVVFEHALQSNAPFIAYLKRQIAQVAGALDSVHFIRKRDDDSLILLDEIVSSHQNVFIVTGRNHAFVGKIVATICHDSLVLRDGLLVPMKARQFTKGSYLVQKGTTQINVLEVTVGQKLPPLLIRQPDHVLSFYLFDEGAQSEIEREIKQLEMRFEKVLQIEEVWFYRVCGVHHSQLEMLVEVLDQKFRMQVLVGDDLSEIICRRLIEGGWKITTAESCTGGMLASEIIKNSGVSSIYDGGIISYANAVKHKELGVTEATLQKYGAVSHECVQEMLQGVMEKFDADFALAISGVAGPTGGTRQKPVGTVYVGAKCRQKERIIKCLSLKGDRTYIREQSVFWALRLLLETNREFFFKKIKKTLDK